MSPSRKYIVRFLVTGFVVLTLVSLSLYWGRQICERVLRTRCYGGKALKISPSGLVSLKIEKDPNVVERSCAKMGYRDVEEAIGLGFSDYLRARVPGGRNSRIFYYDKRDQRMSYFDKKTGLIVSYQNYNYEEGIPEKTNVRNKLYAGPEGISQTPDEELGRFISPMAATDAGAGPMLMVYDKEPRRFFSIRFDKKAVIKGRELSEDGIHKPVQFGHELGKNHHLLSVGWKPPMIKSSKNSYEPANEQTEERKVQLIFHPDFRWWGRERHYLVLNESGRIDLLDLETLEFAGKAAHLIAAPLFGYEPSEPWGFFVEDVARPDDLLAYEIVPITFVSKDGYGKHAGTVVGSVSREGIVLSLGVFNEKGLPVRASRSNGVMSFFETPWGPFNVVLKYVLENLQPLSLSVVSYFAASTFDAESGHRSIFVLPNSFIAMISRQPKVSEANRFLLALLLISPSIMLGIWLAFRVGKDATQIGLSENTRLFFIIATFLFGLSAYITYRLTRPKETLVTCVNCGKPRRPDLEICHHCGNKWDFSELTPPGWRVTEKEDLKNLLREADL